MFDFTNRRVLVGGGGGGIGGAISRAFAEAGAAVVATSVSDSSQRLAADFVHLDIHGLRVDLTDRSSLRAAFDEASSLLGGPPDTLVTAQGVALPAAAAEHSLGDWDRTIELNLTSVFELCQLAGRSMLDAGFGKIVNIASLYSFFGGLRVVAYAASKGGVAQLTKALSNEWASSGVNVNAIAPGFVKTGLNRHVWSSPERSAEILSRIPDGRWGDPADLVGPTLFLASDAADYIHGVVLPVDGGYLGR